MSWLDKHSKSSSLVTASDTSKSDQPVQKKSADIDRDSKTLTFGYNTLIPPTMSVDWIPAL